MLHIQNISCAYDNAPLLVGVNLEVLDGEILCLLGESGSGKTTLLRIIAGLEADFEGDVLLDGQSIRSVPVHERGFGLMFQDFALFPHKDVYGNVEFGLKMRGVALKEREKRVREALSLVGLAGFERRDVIRLSGGERQRVALARSLAPEPRLLMLDEPLGSLDAALRERLAVELRQIIKKVGLTAIYVTHDQQEAYAIADRIAIISRGRIEQIGTPEEVYRKPRTAFVARFLGLNNIVPVLSQNGRHVQTALGTFAVEGQPEMVCVHPDGIRIATEGGVNGEVTECVFRGDSYQLRVAVNGVVLTFKVYSSLSGRLQIGDNIALAIEGAVELYPETKSALA